MQLLVEKFSNRIHLRPLRRNKFKEEIEMLRDIFNDAWSENWGFVPFTEAEFSDLGTTFRLLLRDEYIQIAEVDGVPAAFIVGLPNLNEIFAKLDGSLFPFGWIHMIKKLKYGEITLEDIERIERASIPNNIYINKPYPPFQYSVTFHDVYDGFPIKENAREFLNKIINLKNSFLHEYEKIYKELNDDINRDENNKI